jgi:aspartate kinase
MPLVVQKFGGTSVADSQKILAAARKAIRAQQAGNQVVTVVSAMGKTTDALVDLAKELCDRPPAREMDMLLSTGEQVSVALMAMAIHSLGHKAVSLTGAQIGIRTDSTHTKARIQTISTDRIRRLLDDGNIVIAAGFQGIDQDFNITTLGRGGSDTTAVALAAVLGADACEIYTDVDGVYTTDPRLLAEARRMERISYDEMLELASLGAGVMHNRSIEFAKKFGVPIHVRSSFTDTPGTIITALPESLDRPVCGAALLKNESRVTLLGVPDQPGTSLALFGGVVRDNITVDMIVQNVGEQGRADISFTVVRDELPIALEVAERVSAELGAAGCDSADDVAKVSVVGLGMAQQTGVADRMFRALADAGVNIQMISTSEIKISVLVARADAQTALRVVHEVFELALSPRVVPSAVLTDEPSRGAQPAPASSEAAVVRRLQAMEGLTIDSIDLDASQGRVTISGVPDRPGVAAGVFEQIAAAGIFVDMIVQSSSRDGRAALSFSVPQKDLDRAVSVAQRLVADFGQSGVTAARKVAKLSVSGIGMRSNANVALRMFQALADAGINVEMINTSEVRVNVVVDHQHAEAAYDCLQRAFADVR